ncbi:hypothetical protein IE53DRAFT_316521 [Violaceomyces palustris]|uniref:Uncharacterized protein n=1 Tax=Violaceomyces palustris TaxID=1673888 RepID=A0ACD0NW86_9BASI|nr:hypothetical protein IE53DRAFT_316521 [Violaceomyces palustris]
MPPSASAVAPRRNSFYGRHRTSSATSTGSSSSQKGKSSSRPRDPSPLGQTQDHVTALAVASKTAKRQSTASLLGQASTSAVKIGSESRNILLEDEYQDEVVAYMHAMESQTMASTELMDVQPELRWFMRPYLVDFLIEIHQTFQLRAETLYLTMNIVDRYVSKRIVYKRHYQLVGCAALLIAAKFEDSKDRVPTVEELSQMCCSAYDETAFTQMEGHVLSTIGWNLGHPTAEAWLRIEGVKSKEQLKTLNVARFFMGVSLFHRDFINLTSSGLAKGALILARFICDLPQTKIDSSDEAAKAAQMLDTYVSDNVQDLSLILIKKYSYDYYSSASTVVCDWYRDKNAAAKVAQQQTSTPSRLLPAQSPVSDHSDEEDDDESMCSRSTTPSSMLSTPSRSMEEDDEDDDMPVTPLSLYSLHDPLVAAAQAIKAPSCRESQHGAPKAQVVDKENVSMGLQVRSQSSGSISDRKSKNAAKLSIMVAPAPRPALRTTNWNNVQP